MESPWVRQTARLTHLLAQHCRVQRGHSFCRAGRRVAVMTSQVAGMRINSGKGTLATGE